MKKSPDGFIQLFRNPKDETLWKRPAWLRHGEAWMRKNVGDPCEDFAPSCFCCQMWVAFAVLHDHFSEPYVDGFKESGPHPKKKRT